MPNQNIFTPLKFCKNYERLIFLAGPIQGAKDWQSDAVKYLQSLDDALHIASPRRIDDSSGDYSEQKYIGQLDWEEYHLQKAWRNGVVMFWLAREFQHQCDRAYAQTSRFELGESKVRHEVNWSKLVVGIESGFSGERYIRRRFSIDCPDVLLKDSLKETCKEAVKLYRL